MWSRSYNHLFKWTKWTFWSFNEFYGFTHAGVRYLLRKGTEHTCYFLISLYCQGVIITFLNGQNGHFGVSMNPMASLMLGLDIF